MKNHEPKLEKEIMTIRLQTTTKETFRKYQA
jgi:hypothetical protein